MGKMEDCGFSNNKFYQWVTDHDEYLTVKRIIALVVLIGSFTTMALSEYVVAILAFALLALDLNLIKNRLSQQLSRQGRRAYALACGFMLVLIGLTGMFATLYYAGIIAIMAATFSYVVTWCTNFLLQLKRNNKIKN